MLGNGRSQARQPWPGAPQSWTGETVSGDFFDRLESELASIARDRTRFGGSARDSHRLLTLIRRSAATVLLATALAASLSSEFPATANGSAGAQASLARSV